MDNSVEITAIIELLKMATDDLTEVIKADPDRLYDPELFNFTWGINQAMKHAVPVAKSMNNEDLSERLTKALRSLANSVLRE